VTLAFGERLDKLQASLAAVVICTSCDSAIHPDFADDTQGHRMTSETMAGLQDIESSRDELIQLRRAIHANPEIGHKEYATARLVT
jgi:hypothetical protein